MSSSDTSRSPGDISDASGPQQPQEPQATQDASPSGLELKEEDPAYVGGLFGLESSPIHKLLTQLHDKYAADTILGPLLKVVNESVASIYEKIQQGVVAERELVKRTKTLQNDLTKQQMDIDRTGNRQFLETTDINELRREHLRAENELKMAKEKGRAVLLEIEENRKIKQSLLKDIEEIRRHKVDMIEPQLINSIKEMRSDISLKRHQVQELIKDLEEKEATYELVNTERKRLNILRDKQAAALTKSAEIPVKISKQMDVLKDAIQALIAENTKQEALNAQLDVELKKLNTSKRAMEESKTSLTAEYERVRERTEDLEKQCSALYKEQELSKDMLSHFKVEKIKLEMNSRKVNHELKKDHDILIRTIKEKEELLKTFRNLQTSVDNIQMAMPGLRNHRDDQLRSLEGLHNEYRFYSKKLKEFRKQVDMQLHDYIKNQGISSEHEREVEEQRQTIEQMDKELEILTNEVNAQFKRLHDVELERNVKLRDLKRIETKYKSVQEEKRTALMMIEDSEKRNVEAAVQLKDFTTMYDIIKNERNKFLSQIQASHQRAQEMKEKVKILSNELEILRREVSLKEREVVKKRQENHNRASLREGARNEANNLMNQYKHKRRQIDSQLVVIEGLNGSINDTEVDMIRLKGEYERIIKERNILGVNLLDRNDELCILYEKLNIQKGVMARGEITLNEREEEARKIRILIAELDRKIILENKEYDSAEEYQKKLDKLAKELKELKKKVMELGELMENPVGPNRCRNLPGNDPSYDELLAKISKMEVLLSSKEEKVLEKDLVLEEVATLTERIRKQCQEGQEESQKATGILNDYAKKVKTLSRSMMAKISELSMNQATAISLYQEKCEKEALLENARERLAKGYIPEDIEREFLRLEKMKARRAQEREERLRSSQDSTEAYTDPDNDGFFFNNGVHTAAEPRPNAYIPDSTMLADLPVPKPFGAFAPFKAPIAQDDGQVSMGIPALRFYKKPAIKPIEI